MRLVAFLLLLLSGSAFATGFNATISTVAAVNGTWTGTGARIQGPPSPNSSGCYLLPSMAVAQLIGANCNYGCYPTTITSMDNQGNWQGYSGYNNSIYFTGHYTSCDVNAQSGAMPTFSGTQDPVLAQSGPVSGSSSGGTSDPFDGVFASGVWMLFFSTVVGLWLLSKHIGIVIAAIRRF